MQIDGQRRSEQFEDRGQGSGGGGGGAALGGQLLFTLIRVLGVKGTLVAGVVLGGAYLFAPASLKQALFGGAANNSSSGRAQSACALSDSHESACDFSRAILASTEDAWTKRFAEGELPAPPKGAYKLPKLVVFSDHVSTGGCGNASAGSGPFYCPADERLYLDPTFYAVMEKKLKAPGDFAQAYVIAHEVGHHVQNLIGTSRLSVAGDSKNESSVRVELQADCLAGVWGFSAKDQLTITKEDLAEALNAAHAIGDDALGHSSESDYTHGTSAQRMRWFERGFEKGDARKCDTFAIKDYRKL